MKNIFNIKTLLFVAITSLLVVSCTDDDYQKPVEEVATVDLSAGSADFSKFVSVGNSLTAGFTDGALFIRGQEDSMPNILASKFAMIGGGDFTQPLMDDNVGGFVNTDAEGNFIQEPRMIFNGGSPIRLDVTPTTDVMAGTPGPYNNMGVPGAKVGHLLYPGYGDPANLMTVPPTANPYFVRMASSSTATVMDDAVSQNSTFFSLWIGSNDVLKYAMAGADSNLESITPTATFNGYYNAVVNAMTANGAKGVVLNIVDVTTVPFFTTVPYNAIPLDAATAEQLNTGFAPYNGALVNLALAGMITDEERDARTVNYVEGQNPILIMDESLTDLTVVDPALVNMRPATENDLFILSSKSFIGTTVGGNPLYVNGVSVPLADGWVLIPSEQQEIKTATDAFNTVIQAAATDKGLAYVDANTILVQIANGGVSFDEFTLTNQYALGGMFSLDGIHPTARGNAFMASEMLKAIDATYGSNFEVSGNLAHAKDYVTQYSASLQ